MAAEDISIESFLVYLPANIPLYRTQFGHEVIVMTFSLRPECLQ
jgi:hypothetical protein